MVYEEVGAKIILVGEHSVVYNNPAIAIPFNALKVGVTIKKHDDLYIKSVYYEGLLKDAPSVIMGIKKLIYHILDTKKVTDRNFLVDINSTIPKQRGLGSSAAVSIAIVKALFKYFNITYSLEELIDYSMYAEKIHHTNPSGLDVYTICYQKPIYYIKNQGFTIVDMNFSGALMVFDSGIQSKTKKAIAHVKKIREKDLSYVDDIFSNITSVVNNAKKELETNDILGLSLSINNNHEGLKKLGISNSKIDEIIDKINRLDVLATKITGGGMGGCVISLIENIDKAKSVKEELVTNENENIWIYDLKELN